MQEVVVEVRRLDGGTLRIRHAAEMSQVFFHIDPSANGPKAYDTLVQRSTKDRIEESDVHAINGTMAARSSIANWADLITQGPSPWLAEIDPSWALLELKDQDWASLGVELSLANALRAAFGRGRRLSVVTKVLHMKRPELIPVCDALVLQQVGAPVGVDGDPARAAAFIGHLRQEGRRNLSGLQAIQDRLKLAGRRPRYCASSRP